MVVNDNKKQDYRDIVFLKTDTLTALLPGERLVINKDAAVDVGGVKAENGGQLRSAKASGRDGDASVMVDKNTAITTNSKKVAKDARLSTAASPTATGGDSNPLSPLPSAHHSHKKAQSDLAEIRTPRQIFNAFYTYTPPDTTHPNPKLVAVSPTTAAILDIDVASLRTASALSLLTGTQLHPDATPYAHNYGGHQYGIYAGQLGDGRCVTLGEVSGANGDRWTLQLKGTGPTAYSRGGDGYATLRACLIEFLMTEFLGALGIPTTRALSVVATSRPVYRGRTIPAPLPVSSPGVSGLTADAIAFNAMLAQTTASLTTGLLPNDTVLGSSAVSLSSSHITASKSQSQLPGATGMNPRRQQQQQQPQKQLTTSSTTPQPTTQHPSFVPKPDTAAIITRIAPTWIRFGTFELFHFRDERDRLRDLADYCIQLFYPDALRDEGVQVLVTNALMPVDTVVSTGSEEGTCGVLMMPDAVIQTDNHTHAVTTSGHGEGGSSGVDVDVVSNVDATSSSQSMLLSTSSDALGITAPSESDINTPATDRPPINMQLKSQTFASQTFASPTSQKQLTDPNTVLNKSVSVPLNRYAIFFRTVVKKTAIMVAQWQAYGFIHGMLSTNNMSILGLTLHHGPCGFMDLYEPDWTPNRADIDQQYRFEMQPQSVQWNLTRLGRTLVDLVGEPWISHPKPPETHPMRHHNDIDATTAEILAYAMEANAMRARTAPAFPSKRRLPLGFLFNAHNSENIIRELVKEYEHVFIDAFTDTMCKRLGFTQRKDTDLDRVILPLLELMADTGVDYTLFLRSLCYFRCTDSAFSVSVTVDTAGKHSDEALASDIHVAGKRRDADASVIDTDMDDPLTILLKSLARLHRDEKEYMASIELVKKHDVNVSVQVNQKSGKMEVSNQVDRKGVKPSVLGHGTETVHPVVEPVSNFVDDKDAGDDGGVSTEATSKLRSHGDVLLSSLDHVGVKRRVTTPTQDQTTFPVSVTIPTGTPVTGTASLTIKDKRDKIRETVEASHRLPILSEVAETWKFWAHVYRSRLLSEIPQQNRVMQTGIDNEDVLRMKRMRCVNPRVVLRGWILKEAVDAVEAAFPPVVVDDHVYGDGGGKGKGSKRHKQPVRSAGVDEKRRDTASASSATPGGGLSVDTTATPSTTDVNAAATATQSRRVASAQNQRQQSAPSPEVPTLTISQNLNTPDKPAHVDGSVTVIDTNTTGLSPTKPNETQISLSLSLSSLPNRVGDSDATTPQPNQTNNLSAAAASPNTPSSPLTPRGASDPFRNAPTPGTEATETAARSATPTPTINIQQPPTESTESKHIARLLKVLVHDVWGDTAESSTGWDDIDDRNASMEWAREPTKKLNNLMMRLLS